MTRAALSDTLVAFLETRKELPDEWPEEDPYHDVLQLFYHVHNKRTHTSLRTLSSIDYQCRATPSILLCAGSL